MIRTIGIVAALALAAPAIAQGAPAQSWPVMGDHTLDMPSQGSHSASRPWTRTAMSAKKPAKAKRTR